MSFPARVAWPEPPLGLFQTPFRMQPGLTRLTGGERHFHWASDARRAAKRAVLASALLELSGFDSWPALGAVAPVLAADCPVQCRFAQGVLHTPYGAVDLLRAQASHALPELAGLSPALQAFGVVALCVEEDLAIPAGPQGLFSVLAVAQPSHWAPESKIGLSFVAAHAPVADNALLLKAADSLMKLVMGGHAWQRYVWSVTPSALHDAHPARHPVRVWPAMDSLDGLYLRWERQTFIPVPGQEQAVFTIQINLTPLAQLKEKPALAAALASMSDAVLAYRGLTHTRDRLVGLLHE